MSNSIWKTGDPTYRNNNFDEIIVREYKRWAADGVFYLVDNYCSELPNRWAYLLDIIAQADKAERLLAKVAWLKHNINAWEKVSELKEEYIQRLQKAVDLAVHTLNEICAGVPSDKWVFDEATKATNEIKQLIKGTTNDK